jgi:hypothetical protein
MSIEDQVEIEMSLAKNHLMTRVKNEFRNNKSPDLMLYMEMLSIDTKFGIDLLAQMQIHKRCDVPTLVGCLRHHAESAQEVADMILHAAQMDLLDWEPESEKFIVRYCLSDAVQAELDLFQYPLPMIVEPELVLDNNSTGYLTIKGSIILKDNHHDDDVCLDHINRMNKVRLTLNHDTASMVANQWKGLDKQKDDEEYADFKKRQKAFLKYDSMAKAVMSVIETEGNEFYLTHKYDKRCRTYVAGYHVNYQSAAWNKAVVEFSEKELVN